MTHSSYLAFIVYLQWYIYFTTITGIRAAALVRPFLSELGMVPLPSSLTIPTIQNSSIEEDGSIADNERVEKNAEKVCK